MNMVEMLIKEDIDNKLKILFTQLQLNTITFMIKTSILVILIEN